MVQRPLVDQGLLITEASRSHSDTPHSVGLLWTSDQPDAEASTWQRTTLTRDNYSWPRRDSKPQSQQMSCLRPTPETARPLGSAFCTCNIRKYVDLKGKQISNNCNSKNMCTPLDYVSPHCYSIENVFVIRKPPACGRGTSHMRLALGTGLYVLYVVV